MVSNTEGDMFRKWKVKSIVGKGRHWKIKDVGGGKRNQFLCSGRTVSVPGICLVCLHDDNWDITNILFYERRIQRDY